MSANFHKVVENRWHGGSLAVQHLRALGHSQFAFLGFDRDGDSSLLEHAFRYHARKRGTLIVSLRVSPPTTQDHSARHTGLLHVA